MAPRLSSRTPWFELPGIRESLSRQRPLNLSKLPKLPGGTSPLISRSTPGHVDLNVTFNRNLKAVDNDFAQAVRLEAIAEKKLVENSGKKQSLTVTRFPFVRLASLDIRMVPKKLLIVTEGDHSNIPPKNLRNQRSNLSLTVITPKATVHRFAVVRTRTKRRIAGALDLVVRRGAFPLPEDRSKQSNKLSVPEVKNHKLGSRKPRILLHNKTLANPKAWILPAWAYVIYPRSEVFRMPLPDLVDQLRLGLRKAVPMAKAWQDRYMSPETGEFNPFLSKVRPTAGPSPESKPWNNEKFGWGGRNVHFRLQNPQSSHK